MTYGSVVEQHAGDVRPGFKGLVLGDDEGLAILFQDFMDAAVL